MLKGSLEWSLTFLPAYLTLSLRLPFCQRKIKCARPEPVYNKMRDKHEHDSTSEDTGFY